MNYYRIVYSPEYNLKKTYFGIVESIPDIDEYSDEFAIRDGQEVKFNFKDPSLIFKLKKGIYVDYQYNYYNWRMLSEPLYKILVKYADREITSFYKIQVISDELGNKDYYLLHFKKNLDVIDKKLSIFPNNNSKIPFKVYVEIDKLKGIHLFNYKHTTIGFCVSETVKSEIINQNLTGIDFIKIFRG